MSVPWWGVLPFAMLLGCIATFPLLGPTRKLWHHQWFQLLVALAFGVPMAIWVWAAGDHAAVVHALVEYTQFIVLLLALFVISGGVFVAGDIRATPRNNAIFLAIGAVLASFIGTTGAAMLLIRPMANVNLERENKVHTIVFAIFVIANCGGLLTPLGDPPLFLGMLRGVPFLWTMNLLPEWFFTNGMLILGYFALDRKLYAAEKPSSIVRDDTQITPISVMGKANLLYLGGVIAAVAFAPSVDLHAIHGGHAGWMAWVPFRELAMLGLASASLCSSDKVVRYEKNGFSWGPILEVAALFIGIFLAMVPALKYLAQVAPELPLDEITFFFFTGALSSVLDNAPTYATFFEMAKELGGEPSVAGVRTLYLTSISLGAVLFGAMTYIGNGPNFMVKAIAESAGIPMPTFAGYTLKWAFRYLLPTLVMMGMIFLVQDWRVQVLGGILAAGRAAQDLWQARRYKDPHRHLAPVAEGANRTAA